jgi:phosphate transport system permease protein
VALTTRLSTGPEHAAAEVARRLRGGRADTSGRVFKALLLSCLGLSMLFLAVLLVDQVVKGWDPLTSRLGPFLRGTLRSRPTDDEIGVFQGLWGTFWIGVSVIALSFPIGIGAAIYLEEYATDTRLSRFINVNIRNLAGVPSIVYGILGFAIFVKAFSDVTGGKSVLAAGLTLAVLVLPIVIITTSEAIRAVPDSLREAGYGVGSTKWEVIRNHVLPYAAPGILTGTVLALARALGEAAPLILVGAVTGRLGGNAGFLDFEEIVDDGFTAMPIVITTWAGRPQEEFRALTAAAIVVLLVVVLLANSFAILLRNRYEKKR